MDLDLVRALWPRNRPSVARSHVAWHVLLTLLLALGISFVIALGGLVQAISIAIFSGQTSSIFDGENVGQLVDAASYIKAAFWPPYLIAALLAAIAMTSASTKKSVVGWGTLSIGTALTVMDAYFGGLDGIAVSVVCNYAAGVLLSIYTVVLAMNSRVAAQLAGEKMWARRALWAMTPFIGHMCLAWTLFITLSFLTTIPAAPASFRLEPPLNGYYVVGDKQLCEGKSGKQDVGGGCAEDVDPSNDEVYDEPDYFSVLGEFKRGAGKDFEFIGGGDGLKFEWSKKLTGEFDGAIWVTQGCVSKDGIRKAIESAPFYRGSLSSLRITLDEGLSEFRILESEETEIEVTDENIAQFWVTPSNDDPERLKVSRFVSKATIRIPDRHDQRLFEIGVFPLTAEDSGPVYRSRNLGLTVNKEAKRKVNISVEPKEIAPEANMVCEAIRAEDKTGDISAVASMPYVSLVISIDPPDVVSLEELRGTNEAIVSGANGWISSTGYRKQELDETINGGELSQLSLIGGVRDLMIDGATAATGPTSTLQLKGKFDTHTDGPGILLQGNADYLILNGKRLTTTRWEQLDTGVRVPVILGVPAAVFYFVNFVIATFRRRSSKIWRLPPRRTPTRSSKPDDR